MESVLGSSAKRYFIPLHNAGQNPTEVGQFGRNGDNLVFCDSTGARIVPSMNGSNVMVLPAASRINIGNASNYSFSASYSVNWAQALAGGFVPYIKIENTCTEQDAWAGINVQCTGAGGYETRLSIQAIGQNIVSIPYFQGKTSIATGSLTQGGLALAVNHPSATLSLHWVTGTAYDLTSERLTISASALVINEPGGNVDFRVEGDTEQNLIFVDASTDQVGIGTDTPGSRLEVKGSVTAKDSVAGALYGLAVNNTNSGSAAGSIITLTAGDDIGSILVYDSVYTTSVYAGRLSLLQSGRGLNLIASDSEVIGATIDLYVGGVSAGNRTASFAAGTLEFPSAEIVYLGAPATDGSWRFQRSGNDVIWERRESSVWVTKQTISA